MKLNCKFECEFGGYLKSILRLYGIRNIDVATAIGKTSPFVSHFLSGRAVPSRTQYDAIIALLRRKSMTREEEDRLNKLFIMLKTGIGAVHIGLPMDKPINAIESELLSRFRDMNIDQQKYIINISGKFMIDNALSEKNM